MNLMRKPLMLSLDFGHPPRTTDSLYLPRLRGLRLFHRGRPEGGHGAGFAIGCGTVPLWDLILGGISLLIGRVRFRWGLLDFAGVLGFICVGAGLRRWDVGIVDVPRSGKWMIVNDAP
jgi:hypothetical protein